MRPPEPGPPQVLPFSPSAVRTPEPASVPASIQMEPPAPPAEVPPVGSTPFVLMVVLTVRVPVATSFTAPPPAPPVLPPPEPIVTGAVTEPYARPPFEQHGGSA